MNQSLVNNQHVLPAKSIGRFGNLDGLVQVWLINSSKRFDAAPNNKVFCVKRVWDQRSEQGYGKSIEDEFQSLIEYILNNQLEVLPLDGHQIASRFYALWCSRFKIESYDHLSEGNLVGVSGDHLSEEQKRNIELKHAIYIEEGGVVPKHFKRGLTMQMAIDKFMSRNSINWCICNSNSLEFLVSDNPEGHAIIPLNPHKCLVPGLDPIAPTLKQVSSMNFNAAARSLKYYFAHDINACFNA